ncbi:hypothetical protein HY251_09895, partial [bacterium]|nr:hypothetical protein [bacterium]
TRTKDLYDAMTIAGGKPNSLQRKLLERLTNSQSNIRDVLEKMDSTLQKMKNGGDAKKDGGGDGGGEGGGDDNGGEKGKGAKPDGNDGNGK